MQVLATPHMPLQSLLMKYSPSAMIEIDATKLVNPSMQVNIENLGKTR